VIDKGYEHGREWMAKKVSGIITESEDPKGVERLKIEKELLAVIDELYKSWHTNHTAPVSGEFHDMGGQY
jgi:transcriptional regulator of NAD metabolism